MRCGTSRSADGVRRDRRRRRVRTVHDRRPQRARRRYARCPGRPRPPDGTLGGALASDDDRATLTSLGTIGDLPVRSVDPELLSEARHVHVASYFLQRALQPDLPALFDAAHAGGATTSIDPNWDPPSNGTRTARELLSRTDCSFPTRPRRGPSPASTTSTSRPRRSPAAAGRRDQVRRRRRHGERGRRDGPRSRHPRPTSSTRRAQATVRRGLPRRTAPRDGRSARSLGRRRVRVAVDARGRRRRRAADDGGGPRRARRPSP